jgi:DNA-binding XRE family transcriptional regulator
MTKIKRGDDPRTTVQKQQDEEVQNALEDGSFSRLTSQDRDQSRERARLKKDARRKAEAIGIELAHLRRSAGLTQAQLARIIGTQRTAISRLESGRYGGLTVDRYVAILSAINAASGMGWERLLSVLAGRRMYRFGSVHETIMSSKAK